MISEYCIFFPVGVYEQGDRAGGEREICFTGAQLKWPHRITAESGACSSFLGSWGKKGMAQEKLAWSTNTLVPEICCTAELWGKTLVIHQSQRRNVSLLLWRAGRGRLKGLEVKTAGVSHYNPVIIGIKINGSHCIQWVFQCKELRILRFSVLW